MTSSGSHSLFRDSAADNQTRFKELLDAAALIGVMVDSQFRITYCNEHFLRLAGWSLEELKGRLWHEAFGCPPIESLADMPAAWHCETDIRVRSGGRRILRWSNIVLCDASGSPIAAASIGEDVTERKKLERALTAHSARERGNLEKELHDGLGQELAGIALLARSLATSAERDKLNIAQDLSRLSSIASNAIESCRRIARDFSPLSEMQGGLVHALRQLTVQPPDWYGPALDFAVSQTAPLILTADAANHVYRLAQDWITSSLRHSQPKSIAINLNIHRAQVSLEILDDGIGPPATAEAGADYGVQVAQHRARLLDAQFSIEPRPARGTRLCLSFCQPV
jgi:PAS domain S-box-containing protein